MKKIGVIGGGLAGLYSAYELLKKGYDVTVLEKEKEVGGQLGRLSYGGIWIDYFYHFICRNDEHLIELINELGLKDKFIYTKTKMLTYYGGCLFPFLTPWDIMKFKPLSLMGRLKTLYMSFLISYIYRWHDFDDMTAEEFLIKNMGKKPYEIIFLPLLEKKFGRFYKEVSAAWIIGRVKRRATSRKDFFTEELGVLKNGMYEFVEALEKEILKMGGLIINESEVFQLSKNDYYTVKAASGTFEFDKIIWTIPISRLKNIYPVFANTLRIPDYINVICAAVLTRNNYSDAYWININDLNIPFLGIIDYSKLIGNIHYKGKHLLYLPVYVSDTNILWLKSDSELKEEARAALKKIKNEDVNIKEIFIFRGKSVQPVIKKGHIKNMLPLKISEDFYAVDASQIYPEDRGLNNTIKIVKDMLEKFV